MLNVIGGLDGIDEGEIFVQDKRFSSFSSSEYDSYRNTFIGFIDLIVKDKNTGRYIVVDHKSKSKFKDDKEKEEYEMQTFFIVDEGAATRARIRAMESALQESEAAQKYAEKVSQFVQDGFEKK